MHAPIPPFWFRMRQGKVEAAGADTYRLTAPNVPEAFIGLREASPGFYQPIVKLQADGQDQVNFQGAIATEPAAWQAAFELYRQRLIV